MNVYEAHEEARVSNKSNKFTKTYELFLILLLLIIIIYPVYRLIPHLSINPSKIGQAAMARFYEGFVYNYSHLINPSCLVFTYDPTLFNINNKSATQIGDLYIPQKMHSFANKFKCFVLDYGYWCHTPGNVCPSLNNSYTPIITKTNPTSGRSFGFYYINNPNAS